MVENGWKLSINLSYIVKTMISNMETTFVTLLFFFFIIFLFLGSFRDTALARFSFSKNDRENRKRDIFISERVIRGKLARRDKLGSCFKCRETRNEEEMSEGKCTSGIQ